MPSSDMDTAALEAQLAALEQARIDLATGKMRVSVSVAGRSVTYAKAEMGHLNALIAETKQRLGRGGRRAIGLRFGG